MSRRVVLLTVTLEDTRPPVWRRILVPGGYTLDRVHRVIQLAMGWEDYHLHSFETADGTQYGPPDPDGELEMRDELDVRLDTLATKGARLRYVYDYGDWWEHEIAVDDVLPADPDERYPICVAGERACPPEDIGGTFGFEEFLDALADPGHPRHAMMRELAGPAYRPDRFDPARATTLLRRMA